MMPAPKTPFEIARSIKDREPLTTIERFALESIKQIASEGRRATQLELCAATGVGYQTGALPAILQRLERKGYITREHFQRGMKICLVDLGICTAPPSDQSPHWRERTDPVPSPAIQSIRERSQPLAAMIDAEARRTGKPLNGLLADLVYIGWHQYDQERGE